MISDGKDLFIFGGFGRNVSYSSEAIQYYDMSKPYQDGILVKNETGNQQCNGFSREHPKTKNKSLFSVLEDSISHAQCC